MRLLILATIVAVIGAGQIKVGDHSSASSIEDDVIKPRESKTIAPEITTRETTRRAKVPPHMYKAAFDGWVSLGKHKYKVFWSAKNFDDAENRCRRNGAHLVSIHNELENQFVHTLTSSGRRIESFEDFVYIGLRMNPRTGKWGWTDGSKVDYRQWAVHQPDEPRTEHCAQLHQDPGPGLKYVEDWKWNSIACNRPMKLFVCKR